MKKSAFEEHVELCDLHGGALDHESFADPARGLVRETIDYVARIWERILDSASPPYRSRPLLISIVDSRFLNAAAGPGPRADHILLNSGLVERLVGTANAAFATRLFLPEVGDAEKERLLRTDRPATEFSIPVRLRQKGALWPNCETRREAAREIAHHALRFCLLHELGHLVAAHRAVPTRIGVDAMMNERGESDGNEEVPQVILEIDADTFAGTILQSEIESGREALRSPLIDGVDDIHLATVWNTIAVYLLFRLLTPESDEVPYDVRLDTYPPAFARAYHAMLLFEIAARTHSGVGTAEDPGKTVADGQVAGFYSWFAVMAGKKKPQIGTLWIDTARYFMKLMARYEGWRRTLDSRQRTPELWRPSFVALKDDEIDRRFSEIG